MVERVPGRNVLVLAKDLGTLLETHWNIENTDGILPKFVFAGDVKRLQLRGQDYIVVQNLEEHVSGPADIGYLHENLIYTGNVMAYTAVSYEHGVKMKEEIRRILYRSRIDPFKEISPSNSGIIWIKLRRATDQMLRKRLIHIWTVDFEMHHRYRAVEE